jgi:hypothetical protein
MFSPTPPVKLTPALFKPRIDAGTTPYTPRFATAHAADMAVTSPPPIIVGDVALRIVDVSRDWLELIKFRCGYSGKKAEEEIHMACKQLGAGAMIDPGAGVTGPHYQRVIALERPSGELISWCGITRRHLCEVPAPIPPGGYIFAIATAYAYHGRRLDVQGTRPSDAVMKRALEVMREDLDDGVMPYVWARVLPDNRHSNRLFYDHGFDIYPRPHEEQAIRARPAGLGPEHTRIDWRPGGYPLA